MGRAAARTSSRAADVFELKSASLSLLALVLKSASLPDLAAELAAKLGDTPDVFSQEPLLLELGLLKRESGDAPLDVAALVALLRQYRLQPVALRGALPEELSQALALGLAEAPADEAPPRKEAPRAEAPAPAPVQEVIREVIREVIVEVPVAAPAAPAAPADSGVVKTLVIDKPLRSGQQVYAKGGDLVVLAVVNPGAEVIADGSIHVYAPLRGKAIAGAKGDTSARIFALSLEAELIAIAGTYRTTENPLPEAVLGRAAQIRLEGEKLLMEPLKL
ncbi:septum site-determining protein MinC [Paucibacter sp. KBW04]|uniref:septum site-determining protein MinC n=1 Tax=Paucibacter sp. KBW04 TaxID=2153361 RepID=UPI000F58D52B|nr:septum site-determining protein MinC [Paucibacter sp. KBW04]RQO56492.1 septum site-determining protein MinC [Paucibacter sp. KBW04]